jgi:hypothetical protein
MEIEPLDIPTTRYLIKLDRDNTNKVYRLRKHNTSQHELDLIQYLPNKYIFVNIPDSTLKKHRKRYCELQLLINNP